MVWSNCNDQVLPAVDACDGSDSNCDGIASCGEPLWVKRWGSAADEVVSAVATGPDESIYLTGYYREGLSLGGEILPQSNDTRDVFLAKLNATGDLVWQKSIYSSSHLVPRSLAVSEAGSVALIASFQGTLNDFGAGALKSQNSYDGLVALFESDGTLRWAQQLAGGDRQHPLAVAIDKDENVVCTGYFRQSFSVGSDTLVSVDDYDAFAIKFDTSGEPVFATSFGGANFDLFYAAAFDSKGNVALGGYFREGVTVADREYLAKGDRDLLFVKLDPSGEVLWSRSYGGQATERCYGVVFDSQDRLHAAGTFSGRLSFGELELEAKAANAIFTVALDPSGNILRAQRYGGASAQAAYGLAIDSRDRLVVSGYYEGNGEFGGGQALPAGGLAEPQVLVLKIEADGETLWARGLRVQGDQTASSMSRAWRRVAVDSKDRIVVGGYVRDSIDWTGETLPAAGGCDAFVAKLEP